VVPALNSNPGAFQTLYLDFDGSNAFYWENDEGEYIVRGPGSTASNPSAVPAFDTDGNVSDFSNAEIEDIGKIFQWVSEKYSPFTINVTTVDPGIVQDGRNLIVQVGNSSFDWLGTNNGGIADIDGFHDGGENTCFAFTDEVLGNTGGGASFWQFVGETIAHEAAHEIGLYHQQPAGNPPPTQYFNGDSVRSPIMGNSSNNTSARGIWWRTNNWAGQNSIQPLQDDLAVLTGFGDRLHYRSDESDRNLVFSPGGALNEIGGIIGNNSDADSFTFQATGSRAKFTIKNYQYGGMLAPGAEIRVKSTQQVVPASLALTNTTAVIEAVGLTVGVQYQLWVSGQGQYGDLGQYSITGSQQQFASLDASGRLTIGGYVGNNSIFFDRTIDQQIRVYDSLNGGQAAYLDFNPQAVHEIVIDLGNGDDVVDVKNGVLGFNNQYVDIFCYLGGGVDTLRAGGGSTFAQFSVDEWWINWTLAGSNPRRVFNFNTDHVELYGTLSTDTFNIAGQNLESVIDIFGSDGTDKLTFNSSMYAFARPIVTFHGGAGTDTLEMAMQTIGENQSWNVWDDIVYHHVPNTQAETHYDSTVERISILGGSGNDDFQAYTLNSNVTAYFDGGEGNDTAFVGYTDPYSPQISLPWSSSVLGTVSVSGGNGEDTLIVDDTDNTSVGNYSLFGSGITNNFNGRSVYMGDPIENFDFYSQNGETTTIRSDLNLTHYRLFNPAGGGTGSLILDDRSLQLPPSQIDLYDNRIESLLPTGTCSIEYSGWEAVTLYAQANTNTVNVFGTSPDVATQTTLITGSNADVITVYPRTPASSQAKDGDTETLLTPLGIGGGGGTDLVVIDNSLSAVSGNYVFNNLYGSSTANIIGLGPAVFGTGSDVELVRLLAGSGDDTFDMQSFKSGTGFQLLAGDGNDEFTLGGGNLQNNITSISSLSFDGQAGLNRAEMENEDAQSGWSYVFGAGSMFGSPVIGTYSLSVSIEHADDLRITAGSGADVLNVSSVGTGQSIAFHGGAGGDGFNLPSDPSIIQGHVYFYGDGGTNNINHLSNSTSTNTTVHIDANSIGAFPGDNFFSGTNFGAAAGAVYFYDVSNLSLRTGSGDDVIYASLNPTATTNINAGNGSDAMYLALANAPDFSITPGAPGSGTAAAPGLASLNYTSVEDGPFVDDTAPAVIGSDFFVDAPVMTLDFVFSEDVSATLSNESIELVNLSTGEIVAAANIQLDYDPDTQTGHFTFVGYPSSMLPDGNYTGRIPAGFPDAFGNATQVDATLDFFVLAADANQDRFVDTNDFNILAANFGSTGKVFSQGNFNYDASGTVDSIDFNILLAQYGKRLASPGSTLSQAPTSSVFMQPSSASDLRTSKALLNSPTDDLSESSSAMVYYAL
jgi:hypothetical protein